jgi:hypothetical protein
MIETILVGGREITLDIPDDESYPKHPISLMSDILKLKLENEMLRVRIDVLERLNNELRNTTL